MINIHRMSVTEMQILKQMCGHTILDKIRNDHTRQQVQVAHTRLK